jgi:hypothetical protein
MKKRLTFGKESLEIKPTFRLPLITKNGEFLEVEKLVHAHLQVKQTRSVQYDWKILFDSY